MEKTYQIYLGRERGKRTVHKVGQAKKGCWQRCKNADYLIGMSFEIFPPCDLVSNKEKCLNEAEKFIIGVFADRFTIEHGKEYFRTRHHKWVDCREIFIKEMTQFLCNKGWDYVIHEGWVSLSNEY